jgi:imidazolonepropionase-like amidohydrolase
MRRASPPSLFPTLAAALLMMPAVATAQSGSLETESGTWALTNARIETVTKGTIDRGTIIIRNGVIEAVGANVTVPADARVVDLSGRILYPGFFDLTSSLGLPAPTGRGGGRGEALVDFAPNFAGPDTSQRNVGLEPNRLVANELRLTTADVRAARDQGITTALVAPPRGLFRGLSALVPLRDDTATRWIVKSPVALHIGYETVPGQYPGSLLGVIAYQRQAFYDAQRHAQIMDRYKANPRGMTRLTYNADLDALVPVIKGELPAFIAANNENEIIRAMDLAKEFKIKATIVGGAEAFRAVDRMKESRTPIISVNFPEPNQTTGWQYYLASRETYASDSAARVANARKVIEGNAAALSKAGVKFALTSGGATPANFIANVKKAIAAGLPRNVALEALTIRAAEAAGVDTQLGSIEPGKIANLLVMEGEALTDAGRLRGVFVDGQHYDVVPAPPVQAGRGGRGNTPPQQEK